MEREQLGFIQSAEKNFNYLIDHFGFRLVKSNQYLVVYKKGIYKIELYHERISFELYIVFSVKRHYVPLNQIFEYEKKPTRFYQGSTFDAVEFCVKSLAAELQLFMTETYAVNNASALVNLIKKATSVNSKT